MNLIVMNVQLLQGKEKKTFMPTHEILLLVAHAQKQPLNTMLAYSKFGLTLSLQPYFVFLCMREVNVLVRLRTGLSELFAARLWDMHCKLEWLVHSKTVNHHTCSRQQILRHLSKLSKKIRYDIS